MRRSWAPSRLARHCSWRSAGDTSTGTLRVRAKLPNPKPREFSPGMFMKVHLPVGLPHSAMLVPEEAVGTDQGEKFVFVVDAENIVRQRRLKAGSLYFQKWRAVDSGLNIDDRIIISGLQRVRPGMPVTPQEETAHADDVKVAKR